MKIHIVTDEGVLIDSIEDVQDYDLDKAAARAALLGEIQTAINSVKSEAEPAHCECDNTHQASDTVCRWCWARGRRHWNDPDVDENSPVVAEPEWTEDEQRQAVLQGWHLAGGIIERVDLPDGWAEDHPDWGITDTEPRFESDDAACEFVKTTAINGDALCLKALRLFAAEHPEKAAWKGVQDAIHWVEQKGQA